MSAFTHPFLEEPAEREHYGDEKKKSPPATKASGERNNKGTGFSTLDVTVLF